MKPLSKASGLFAVIGLVTGLCGAGPAHAADQKATFAMPNRGIAYAYAVIADAMGYWKEQGLDVETTVIDGPGTLKALLAGDVQFAGTSGVSALLTVAASQPGIAIANVHTQINEELVLSPDAARKTGLDPKTATVTQRAHALKGMIIASDAGPNTIPDAFLRHIVVSGGLDPERDLTITYLAGPAEVAALKSKKVDGMVMSPPFTTQAAQEGAGVMWVSGASGDLPDLNPFVYTTISAMKPYCDKNPDICTKFLTGVWKAIALMKADPEKGLQLLGKFYTGVDPQFLKEGYLQQIGLLNPTGKMTESAFRTTQDLAVGAGMLKPAQARTSFEGAVYSNAYLK